VNDPDLNGVSRKGTRREPLADVNPQKSRVRAKEEARLLPNHSGGRIRRNDF